MALKSPNTIQAPRAIYVDQLSDGTAYIGIAKPGASGASAIWQIRKLVNSGTVTQILWADGNEKFDNVWNNRTSLSYS